MLKLKEKLCLLFSLKLCTCSLQHDFCLRVLENALFFYSSCLTTLFCVQYRSSSALFERSCVTAFSLGNEGLCHACTPVLDQVQEGQASRQGVLQGQKHQGSAVKCVSGLSKHHQQQ